MLSVVRLSGAFSLNEFSVEGELTSENSTRPRKNDKKVSARFMARLFLESGPPLSPLAGCIHEYQDRFAPVLSRCSEHVQ